MVLGEQNSQNPTGTGMIEVFEALTLTKPCSFLRRVLEIHFAYSTKNTEFGHLTQYLSHILDNSIAGSQRAPTLQDWVSECNEESSSASDIRQCLK